MQQRKSDYWCVGTLRTIVFFMVALLVFSAVRLFFFLYYRAEQSFFSEWPALVLGARLDAKWFAILLLPAWITWLLGLWRAAFLSVARWLAVTALAVFILLGLINIGFYGFYVTPISSLIFGFLQDDTQAILITLWRNWPIVTYVAAWCLRSPQSSSRFLSPSCAAAVSALFRCGSRICSSVPIPSSMLPFKTVSPHFLKPTSPARCWN